MKIKAQILALFAVTLFVIASCTNPEKVLPKKDGAWKYIGTSSNSTGVDDAGTITFTKTAVTFVSDSFPIPFQGTWKYDNSNDKVTLTVGSTSMYYTVTSQKRNSETWVSTDSTTGEKYTLNLTRK